jgi:hypothetical protein
MAQPSDTVVLKLHGSMNWLVSLFGGQVGLFQANGSSLGSQPVIHRVDLEYLGCEDFAGQIFDRGAAFPCLILPDREKRFFYQTSFGPEYPMFWDLLWSQAADVLKCSDRIVVCGYSLLPVDQRACELLLDSPGKDARIEVVSGSQTDRIAGEFRSRGIRNVVGFNGGYFADWLAAQGN